MAEVDRRTAESELNRWAEANNAALTTAIANSVWPRYAEFIDGARSLPAEALRDAPETQRLLNDLRNLVSGLDVLKIKLYEPGKYSCGPIMAITGHNIMIGKRSWNKLPKDIQDIFLDQAKKSHQDYLNWLEAFESNAVKNIQSKGR